MNLGSVVRRNSFEYNLKKERKIFSIQNILLS